MILTKIFLELWSTLQAMAPYLLFGFVVAGVLSVFVSPALVQRHLGSSRFGSVMRAALFGVPLPLCSCSVIPVTLTLRRHGASRGAASAFLLSTPQTGVDSILVTYGLLGPLIAIYRPLAAFCTGMVGGSITNYATRAIPDTPPEADKSCPQCAAKDQSAAPRWKRAIHHAFITLPSDSGMPMLLGLLIAGLIATIVPDDLFAGTLGNGPWGMLLMMVMGIPVYVCATASVPIAAALIAKGLSPGAALVFLMTGPATNAAGIMAVWHAMGRRTAIIYLLTTAICALVAGYLFNLITSAAAVREAIHTHHMSASPLVESAAAIVLLMVLIAPQVRKWYGRFPRSN